MIEMRISTKPETISRRTFLRRAIVAGVCIILGDALLSGSLFSPARTRRAVAWAEVPGTLREPDRCTGPNCLSEADRKTLEALTTVVVPADEAGPGAREAGVASLIEGTLKSNPTLLKRYADGLQAFDELARGKHQKAFADLPVEQQTDLFLLVEVAKNHIWPKEAPLSMYGKVEWRLRLWYYRKYVGITDASMVLQDQIIRDVSEAFYATTVAWDSLGYSGPPFPFGYVGRQSRCSSPSA